MIKTVHLNKKGKSIYPREYRADAITYTCLVLFFITSNVKADVYFNPAALEHRPDLAVADLDYFSEPGGQAPGDYIVNIYINNEFVKRETIKFSIVDQKLIPKIPTKILERGGVKPEILSRLSVISKKNEIENLEREIKGSKVTFKFNDQRLDVTIPQIYINNISRGYVDPKELDSGITAGIFNYSYTGSSNKFTGSDKIENYDFISLQSGANFGAWRLRNYSTYSHANNSKVDSVYTYLQRDISSLTSQITIGQTSSPGDIFDSLQFNGVQLVSDDNQLPDSMKGYAPIIRGIAQSNSQVTIRQNGSVIYQTYVPSGAFEITDLYPTGSQGDLEITISGVDGFVQKFIQPFSSLPIMQREGRLKYAAVIGKYRASTPYRKEPIFSQLSAIYGLPGSNTIYVGTIFSNNYSSLLAGVGHGFAKLGSLSFDITGAKSNIDSTDYVGSSYRIQYSKNFAEIGTYITASGYRYSSSGFYDFREANETQKNFDYFYSEHKRSRAQLSITQNLMQSGSVYASGYIQDQWGRAGSERSYNFGYNTEFLGINWNIGYTRSSYSSYNTNNDIFYLNLQIPLNKFSHNTNINYSVTSMRSETMHQAGVSGTAMENNNLSYNIIQGLKNPGGQNTGSFSAGYKGTYGNVDTAYNYSQYNRQLNYSFSGGVLAHNHGLTFTQRMGDTVALVSAPGAEGIKIENQVGIETDWRGYAVVPYLSSYRKNRVSLDRTTMPKDIDLLDNIKFVSATKGAVVVAKFTPRIGKQALFKLYLNDKTLPFGTVVALKSNEHASYSSLIDENGQVYLSGLPIKGDLVAVWGKQENMKCNVTYDLSNFQNLNKVISQNLKCNQDHRYDNF